MLSNQKKSGFICLSAVVVLVLSAAAWAGQQKTMPNSALAPKTNTETKRAEMPKQNAAAVVDPGDEYRVGIEDELTINVWHEPELSSAVVVRPDGVITLPLLNDVPVVGLTTKELQALLTEKLKGFVTEPQVTVIVRGIRSRKVYLMGEVPHPGAFPMNNRKTVLQLLAEAGGIGPYAKGKSIYVLRKSAGKQERLAFNYKKAMRDSKYDIELTPGDMIVVP